jgi:hypothetical protein
MCVEDRAADVNTDAVVAAEEVIVAAVGVEDVDVAALDLRWNLHSSWSLIFHIDSWNITLLCVIWLVRVFQQ